MWMLGGLVSSAAVTLQLALAFQVALFAIRISRDTFVNTGVLTSAFLLGLTDMDALTFSMARLGSARGRDWPMAPQVIPAAVVRRCRADVMAAS